MDGSARRSISVLGQMGSIPVPSLIVMAFASLSRVGRVNLREVKTGLRLGEGKKIR